MRSTIAVALTLAALAAPALANDPAKLLEEARFVAQSLPPKMITYLQRTIQDRGVVQALTNYSHLSPKVLVDAGEETGWKIRQISMKNRNPKGKPDAWEAEVLKEFEKRLAAGEPAVGIDKGMIVSEGGKQYYRYMQPMITVRICMECHGPEDHIKPEVKALMKEMYPDDAATGYTEGMLRGALTMRKPL
jgi:hypothetical protein